MKNKSLQLCLILLTLLLSTSLRGNNPPDRYRILFYNVENLFDTEDDPITSDEEFLPKGDRFWNGKKLNNKLNRIFQVIMATGEGRPPVLVGLCEVENQAVLEMLLYRTGLGKLGYQIVHRESPDRRGIDVALLYRNDLFTPFHYEVLPVTDPRNPDFKTRDILYTMGTIEQDTLHVFVNHWPSKYGGVMVTKALRALAAQTLRNKVNELTTSHPGAKIIIMGDFNDSPLDESVQQHLKTLHSFDPIQPNELYNLAYPAAIAQKGSNKYQGKWEVIDQMIVSGALLNTAQGLKTEPESFRIFEAPFLLEDDQNYLGKKPFRTYLGFRYNNGFSDHLPVLIDLKPSHP
ncbi:MAG: endonuclease [Prolixibacteraceae bacterium]|nr:endonuclease [Prolixibacteraceae bacterium]